MKKLINNFINSQTFDFRYNSFDFIRLVLSILVVINHSESIGKLFRYSNIAVRDYDNTGTSIGTLSVYCFFIISGFLITRSFLNSKSAGDYIINRFKRIYPGFVVSLFVISFLFVPLYFFLKNGFDFAKFYSIHTINMIEYFVQNIFVEIRKPSVALPNIRDLDVNGSYWTLIHEVRAYFLVLCLGLLGILNKRFVILLLAFLINIAYILSSLSIKIPNKDFLFRDFFNSLIYDSHLIIILCYFIFGMLFYTFQAKIIWNKWFYTLSIIGLLIGLRFDIFPTLAPTCLTYFVLYSSQILPFRKIVSKIGDLSYGIYIYSWPIQLCLFYLGLNKITDNKYYNYILFVTISILASMVAGYLSWNLVEKKWLSKKNNFQNTLAIR